MTLWPEPKINLGLNVIRKRPDGFHELETLFVPHFGLRDRLDIEISDKTTIEIVGPKVDWDPMKDLTMKAYLLLKGEFDLAPVRIKLEKHIPVGAGLGGGSSDAAHALLALNDIFALGLTKEQLAERAAKLGSDCAFFIYNTPMFGSGRGEILEPYEIDLDGYEIRLDIPEGSFVSTKEAYAGISPAPWDTPLKEILKTPVEEWKDSLGNDFEPSVFRQHPEIEAMKAQFYEDGAVYASMSGSGASVFGLYKK